MPTPPPPWPRSSAPRRDPPPNSPTPPRDGIRHLTEVRSHLAYAANCKVPFVDGWPQPRICTHHDTNPTATAEANDDADDSRRASRAWTASTRRTDMGGPLEVRE